MGIYFIKNKKLLGAIIFLLLSFSVSSFATELARVEFSSIFNESDFVSEVKIDSSSVSDLTYKIAHSGEEKSMIRYEATVVNLLKGAGKVVTFISRKTLIIDKEYLILLHNQKQYSPLVVAHAGYAAIELDTLPIKGRGYRAARFPVSFFRIPTKELQGEPSKKNRNEHGKYIWYKLDDILELLEAWKH